MDTKAQELAHRLRTGRTELATIQEAAAELLHLEDELAREQAKAKELEAQLEAIGAGGVQPLRPQQVGFAERKPLSDEQRNAIFDKLMFLGENGWEVDWWNVIDEVEAAHGIKGGRHG